jgi:hypothetical protein
MHETGSAAMKIASRGMLALLALLPAALHAQPVLVFPQEQAAFQAAVTGFLTDADKKEGGAFITGAFAPWWNGPYLTAAQRSQVIAVANTMLKKRFRPLPDPGWTSRKPSCSGSTATPWTSRRRNCGWTA